MPWITEQEAARQAELLRLYQTPLWGEPYRPPGPDDWRGGPPRPGDLINPPGRPPGPTGNEEWGARLKAIEDMIRQRAIERAFMEGVYGRGAPFKTRPESVRPQPYVPPWLPQPVNQPRGEFPTPLYRPQPEILPPTLPQPQRRQAEPRDQLWGGF